MTIDQVEKTLIDMIHREPFLAFVVEMKDGSRVEVPHARLALDDRGAVFFGPDGGLIDFEYKTVRAIRPSFEVVA